MGGERHDRQEPKTMKRLLIAAILAFAVVGSAGAQVIGKTMTVANMPACNSDKNFGLVTDATNATTLGAGGGTAKVWVKCVSGTWTIQEVAAVSDLSAYLPVSGTTAAAVVIQNSGAGNDISLIALDDLFLTPGDALTVAPGGAAAITTTAGAISLTAGGTTQDITLTSVDDIIFAATDDTTFAGDAVTFSSTTVSLNPGGSTAELSVATTSVAVGANSLFYPPKASAPPVACSGGTAGGEYYDTDINKLCRCNGTNFVLANDDSTTTGCS